MVGRYGLLECIDWNAQVDEDEDSSVSSVQMGG